MEALRFYEDLEPIESFDTLFDRSRYHRVPEDWFVAVTDVVNSTEAIEDGRYKHVNVAGSLGAMALANITRDFSFPFLFGGDGMLFVLPPQLERQARSVLADVRRRVRANYGLLLRAGIVPVTELYRRGAQLQIGKLRVSEHYQQALFSGDGVALAERLIKQDEHKTGFLVPEDYPIDCPAELDGFSCRWKDVPSSKGEIVSVIIRLRGDEERQTRTLQRVLGLFQRVLGDDNEYHPLNTQAMEINRSREAVGIEARAVLAGSGRLPTFLKMLWIRFEILVTSVILALDLPVRRGRKRLNTIREDNVINSDFRKYDGTLKMVVSTSTPQREILQRLLDDMRRQRSVQYGLHVSDRALMTCLIHFQSGDEVHFVDGADGGYALAARQLKRQVAEDGEGAVEDGDE
jgi:hypothetical protein